MRLQDQPFRKKQIFISALVAATCLITFQAYLIAPLIPVLQKELHATPFEIGLSIPAFAIPFGFSSFLCSIYVDLVDRKKTFMGLLTGIFIGLILLSNVHDIVYFLLGRAIIGTLAGGVVQLAMSMMNDLFTIPLREEPFNWIILAQAAGMTFGPTAGACLFQLIGWRGEFTLLAVGVLPVILLLYRDPITTPAQIHQPVNWRIIFRKCRKLLSSSEGKKIYPFIYLNGIFHSGLFIWTSYYFSTDYDFGNQGTGLILLLFSLPGLLLAVSVGSAVKKYGVPRIMFWGLVMVGAAVAVLSLRPPLWVTLLIIGALSVAYVMSQPFYARIINTARNRRSRGVGTGLGFGLLFLGYGTGPVIFQFLLRYGIFPALMALGALEIILGLLCREQREMASNALAGILSNSKPIKNRPHK